MRRIVAILLVLVAFAVYGVFHLARDGASKNGKPPLSLVFFTGVGATTAQAPFWAAVRNGWPAGMDLETRFWKDLDDLRSIMLAGKGDVWVGHIEGFAQAAMRGAPVTLLAVTAWRKFYFLTADPGVTTLQALSSKLERSGERLAMAPPDSPAFAILNEFTRRGGPRFTISRQAPRQLMLEAARGRVRHLLVPEPLATLLMMKRPELRVVACLEEEYSRQTGGNGMLPVAGIAVRSGLLREHPGEIAGLLQMMMRWADAQTPDTVGKAVAAVLPETTLLELGKEVVLRSLRNDPVRVVPAWAAREDVAAYLAVVFPEAVGPEGTRLPPSFFMEKPWR